MSKLKFVASSYQSPTATFTDEGWLNATEAAASFGKRPIDWLKQKDLRFREANTRLGAKPRHTRAPAKSENSACAYAPEGWLGCAVMARTRLGSGIARDLKTCRTGCGTSFIRKKICVGV